jgi:hypothetical protein
MPKKYEEACTETQPVIYIGVESQHAKGFDTVKILCEDSEGLIYSEQHLKGVIYVRMKNNTLELHIKRED